jgi:hypothetical protein
MVERALVDCRAMTPPAIPDAFRAVLAGLNEQERPRAADTFLNCFGCGPEHPDGLYVRAFPTEEGVLSPIVVARRYEGPPGAAHGGIIAATGELTVRYVAPAPLETPLLGRGRMVADHGRYIDVEGTIELLTNGQVVARARGRFFPVANSSRVT